MSTIQTHLERVRSGEEGSALVSAVLILMLLTVLASGGYWVSRGEMGAAQGFSQSVRALYVAESGLARFFAADATPSSDTTHFEFYPDPCADTIAYPLVADQNACYADDDSEEEDLLEDFAFEAPPPVAYALTNANVYLTADFVINTGGSPIYLLRSEARVEDAADASMQTIRAIETYASLAPPFEITSVFAATGGVDFGGDDGDHYHFDGKAKKGKTGGCGTETAIANITIPTGQFDLPLPDSDCPDGKDCPYKWHMKGGGTEVDSTASAGSVIVAAMGIDWSELLSNEYFSTISGVVSYDGDEDDDFEETFESGNSGAFKAASSWPITRFGGDLETDQRVKGYGVLIVNGDLLISNDKFEWTGLLLVGGTITTLDGTHIHVKGAVVAGLGCSDVERAAGDCRSVFDGEHNDMKYRPCEVSQAWNGLMHLRPLDDLFREASPGN